jgi:hypothetical protein
MVFGLGFGFADSIRGEGGGVTEDPAKAPDLADRVQANAEQDLEHMAAEEEGGGAEKTLTASQMGRTGSGLKGDLYHRSVSWVVDNPAAQRFTITGGDGVARDLYQFPGELNDKPGVYEWIIDRSGSEPVIVHQRFIPGGSVTGGPNQ